MSGRWGTSARAGYNSGHGQMPQAVIWDTGFAVIENQPNDFSFCVFFGQQRGFCTFVAVLHRPSSRSSRGAAYFAFAHVFSGRCFVKNMLRMLRQI